MGGFFESACRHFDFLVSRYGFVRGSERAVLPELGDGPTSVRYEGPHLFIWIHLDKDEVCVSLFVKVHTSILRPGGRRLFQLQELLRRTAPQVLKPPPPSETPLTAPENHAVLLRVLADGLREHCDALLRMDLKPLEDLYSHP